MNWYLASPNSAGRVWPSSLFSSGLGSNVSRWLGPPAMNRKMTDLALAGRCGGLAASGFAVAGPRLLLAQQRRQRQAAEAAEGVAQKGTPAPFDANGPGRGGRREDGREIIHCTLLGRDE